MRTAWGVALAGILGIGCGASKGTTAEVADAALSPPPDAAETDAAAPDLEDGAVPFDVRTYDYAPFDDVAAGPVPDAQPFVPDVAPAAPVDPGQLPAAPPPATPAGCDALGTGPVASLAYSPDGALLAVGTFFGAIQLYRADTQAPAGTLWAGTREISSVDFSRDGSLLVAVSRDEAVRVLRVADLSPVATLKVPAAPPQGAQIRHARFTADAATVLVGFAVEGQGTLLGHFRVSDGALVSAIRLGNLVSSLAGLLVTPDRSLMVLMGNYQTGTRQFVEVRRTADDTRVLDYRVDPEAAIALSSDGSLLAYGPDVSSQVRVVRLADGQEVAVTESPPRLRSMIFTPDGKQLLMGQPGSPPFHLTARLSTGKIEKRVSKLGVGNLAFANSPDGKTLAYGYDDGFELTSNVDGRLLKSVHGPRAGMDRLALSPDGTQVAAVYPDQVLFWPLTGDRTTHVAKLVRNDIARVAFSPDGKRLAVAARNLVVVLDTQGALVWSSSEFAYGVVSVGFSADGTLVGASTSDSVFVLHEAATGKVVFRHVGPASSDTLKDRIPLAFSPTGKQVAVGVPVGIVFDAETHVMLRMLPARATALAYLPDGSELAVGTNKITFLRADIGAETRSLPGLGQYLTDLAFSGDGKLMLAIGYGTGWRLTRLADGSAVPGIPGGGDWAIGGNKVVNSPQPAAIAVFCDLK
jgi:WD40 repeat protein